MGKRFFGSRTAKFAAEEMQRKTDTRVADLEGEVEELRRSNLRLSHQLIEETGLRARAEKQLATERRMLDELNKEVAKKKAAPRKRAPAKKVTPDGIPAKATKPKAEPAKKTSARKRGNVK